MSDIDSDVKVVSKKDKQVHSLHEKANKLNDRDYILKKIYPNLDAHRSIPTYERSDEDVHMHQTVHQTEDITYHNKKSKIIKIIVVVIPLLIVFYLLFANFIVSHSYYYTYDIGSVEDAEKPFLSPVNRTSDVISQNPNYRYIESTLTYFDIPILINADTVRLSFRFKEYPNDAIFYIDTRNNETWNYKEKTLYNPFFLSFSDYPSKTVKDLTFIRINPLLPLVSKLDDVPKNSYVATDSGLRPVVNDMTYDIKPLTINTTLRSGHVFYIYIKDGLSLNVKKQDLNYYNGSDELNITLYDLDDNIIANISIPDDGIITSATLGIVLDGTLNTNVKDGVYRLEFSAFDGLIREINLNTDKIVTKKLFLADYNGYIKGIQRPSSIYYVSKRNDTVLFYLMHAAAAQNVTINNAPFNLKTAGKNMPYPIGIGEYYITSDVNDIIITSQDFMSFSKESYFEPFKFTTTTLSNDIMKKGVDYIIINNTLYADVKQDNGWIISTIEFDMKDLYVIDNKLSIMLENPHLTKNNTKRFAIDYINITVRKNGIFQG